MVLNKGGTNDEGLCQPIWRWLYSVLQVEAPLFSTAKQLPKSGSVMRCRNDEDFSDASQHERAERIIDHWLIKYRQQLLRQCLRNRIQSGSRTSSEDNAFACHTDP